MPKRTIHPLSRREFVRWSATSASVLATGSLSLLSACTDTTALDPSFARGGNGNGGGNPKPPVARNPLRIPNAVSPTGITLTEAPFTADLGGGDMAGVWAYNEQFPGPTLVANQGPASILLKNRLPDETITHWHGGVIDDANDGHPRFAIPPEGEYQYNFTVQQRACLNWYHPHPHGKTGEQVNLGLAGAFIIRDAEENALGLPSGAYEIPLIIRDATRDKAGNLEYRTRRGGFDGKLPLVNGTLNPGLEVDTAVYRFRILNGANARIFNLALSNGASFTLIGNDGGLLEQSVDVAAIDMSPAERVDVLVDFRRLNVGDTVMLRDLRSGWDLLEFTVANSVNDTYAIPTQLSTIPLLKQADVARERVFSFDGMSRINGQEFEMVDPPRIDAQVPLGDVERWIFTTVGNAPHPVHVHASPFQVQSRSGGRGQLYPWEAGWKDTVLLEDGETVEVLVRFTAYKGIYLMHCHKLEHEDAGMMMNFEIV